MTCMDVADAAIGPRTSNGTDLDAPASMGTPLPRFQLNHFGKLATPGRVLLISRNDFAEIDADGCGVVRERAEWNWSTRVGLAYRPRPVRALPQPSASVRRHNSIYIALRMHAH